MIFHLLRACAITGDEVYESISPAIWQPWRTMLKNNLTTWEAEDVRQSSDWHAWESAPIHVYCVELADIHVVKLGCAKILWKPRLNMSPKVKVKVAFAGNDVATFSWKPIQQGQKVASWKLAKAIDAAVHLLGHKAEEHGVIDKTELTV